MTGKTGGKESVIFHIGIKKNFIYFWLHWVFVAARRLSLVVRAGAILCCSTQASHCGGFSCCRAPAPEALAQQSWCMGLVALWHVGASLTRDQTCVPCIGRILKQWTTKEVLMLNLIKTQWLIVLLFKGLYDLRGREPSSLQKTQCAFTGTWMNERIQGNKTVGGRVVGTL